MRFVAPEGYASSYLRGEQVASHLGVQCLPRMDDTQDDTVIFVKLAEEEDVKRAKKQGNVIAYDVLDFFCYPDRFLPWAHLVDVLITPNETCEPVYKTIFPNAEQVVIPHQWDSRISGECPQDKPRLAYIGAVFNMPISSHLFEVVVDEARMVGAAKRFNLHICVSHREDMGKLLKPATKVATAAAVGACAVTYLDPSAMELLGEDYPFYVHDTLDDAIHDAMQSFGKERWFRARNIMNRVKEKTSLEATANLYRQLESVYA